MPEIYTWNEGRVFVWSGSATASAAIAYMENMQAMGNYGWKMRQSVEGVYDGHLTGLIMNVSFQYLYGADATLMQMVQSATGGGLHFKIDHSAVVNGSAGLYIWSSYIDSFALVGNTMNPYSWSINLHSHSWSAYGNG